MSGLAWPLLSHYDDLHVQPRPGLRQTWLEQPSLLRNSREASNLYCTPLEIISVLTRGSPPYNFIINLARK